VHADPIVRNSNGRTSRLAKNLEHMRAGFPTSIILLDDRAAYLQSVDKAGTGADCGPFDQQLGRLVEQSFDPFWFLFGIA
jgi:hypothetical protein